MKIRPYLESYLRFISHIRFQIIIISAALIYTLVLFCLPLSKFYSTNPYPSLLYFLPKKMSAEVVRTVEVKTGLFIRDFYTFDINKNDFGIEAIIWFEFSPSRISLETVDKFSFEKGTILYKSAPETRIIKDKLLAKYNVRVQFSTNLDHHFFPFNDHTLFVVLTNEFVSPEEMIYSSAVSSFEIAKNIYSEGWKLIGKKIESGYSTSKLDAIRKEREVSYPRVVFSLNFAKPGLRKILLILIPLFLLFFLSAFSISLDPLKLPKAVLTLVSGSLAGILSYRFVIEQLSPEVSYTTATDYIYTLILTCTFIVFLYDVYLISQGTKKTKFTFLEQFLRRNFFIFLQIFVLIILHVIMNSYAAVIQ